MRSNWSRYGMRVFRFHTESVASTTSLRPYALARYPFPLISDSPCSSIRTLAVQEVCVLCPSPEPETNWRGLKNPQPDLLNRTARGYRHVSRSQGVLVPCSRSEKDSFLNVRLSLDRCLVLSRLWHQYSKLSQSTHSF